MKCRFHFGCMALLIALIGYPPFAAQAQTGVNLLTNGTFGTATYSLAGSTFNPSSLGWVVIANGSTGTALRSQSVAYGCTQFYCYGGTAYNWFGGQGTAQMGISTTAISTAFKPSTRYRLSFYAIRDITSLPATDPTYNTPATLAVRIFSGSKGNYLTKDVAVKGYKFNDYVPDLNRPFVFEFTTPVATNSSNLSNIDTPQLQFMWPTLGKYAVIFTNVSLQEVSEVQAPTRVAVTNVYPTLGNKVATLIMPQGSSTTGLKWRLRYGSSFATTGYSVSIPFYAVVTGANGLPVKDANGHYTLQTDSNGNPISVGGTGTGGQGTYSPPANGVIPSNALQLDTDSGDYTYTLDFSNYGVPSQTINPPVLDGSVTPSPYTTADGLHSYYIIAGSTVNNSSGSCCGALYSIEVVDSTGKVVATSPGFSILNNPYDNLKKDALYSFYHQRSGVDINPLYGIFGYNFEGSSRSHAAGHKPDLASCWANGASNIDKHGNDWGNSTGCLNFTQDVTGGWYDAADHGKYVVNGGVALWTLQNMIERLQNKDATNTALNNAFPAGQLQLPSTLNAAGTALSVSDLMAEARVEMEWMLKMQVPNGTVMKVPLGYQDVKQTTVGGQGEYQVGLDGVQIANTAPGAVDFGGGKLPRLRIKLNLTNVNVGGMVFHAVHDRAWTGIPLNPANDTQQRALMYPTTAATLNFAAVAAQCYRIWLPVDSVFANKCLNASKTAWNAAKAFRTGFTDSFTGTVVPAKSDIFRYEYSNQAWDATDPSGRNKAILQYGFALNPMFDGGGAYGDLRVGDEFYWAGAELYLATAASGTPDVSYHTYGKAQGVLTGVDINGQYSKCEQTIEPVRCYSWINGFDWQNTSALGTISLLTYSKGQLASAKAKANILEVADGTTSWQGLVGQTTAQGYHFAKQVFDPTNRDTQYEWGANGGVLNRAILLAVAYDNQTDPTKKQQYLASIVASMGYLLGRNTLEKSFISGYGNKPLVNPHHRWFAKNADVAYPLIPAGFIAGGPNTRDIPALRANAPRYQTQADVSYALSIGVLDAKLGGIADASQLYFDTNVVANCVNEAATTAPTYLPQRCYSDHFRSFATNEVAINWQAPLVWVSQFLSETYK